MNKKILITLVVVIAAAAGVGWWVAQDRDDHRHALVKKVDEQGQAYWTCPMHPQVRQDHPGNCPICGMKLVERKDPPAAAPAQRQVRYWYDPMKPEVHFDKPGKSPFMDMELQPKYAEEGQVQGANDTIIQIDPRMAQNLGMRTAEVERGTFWQRVDTVGSVAVDERRIVSVEARAAGWVERLDVRAVGDSVRRGQVVAGIYSPELLAAQEELALARKLGDATLIDAARTRLSLLGAGGGNGGPQRRVGIVAPEAGVVTELMVREGAQVTPGMPLMKLADLSSVWILAEVPESQAAWVSAGKPVEARLKSQPERLFEGKVDYVYPILDSQTRTLKVRLVFDNPDMALKPGMFAEVSIFGGAQRGVVLVPSEAVIRTGERSVVLVAEGAGRYRPVHVELGPERQDHIVILSGLSEGQKVVVSGQFLLDSEASLLGAYQRMGGTPGMSEGQMDAGSAP